MTPSPSTAGVLHQVPYGAGAGRRGAVRAFAASRGLVFHAFTRPELLRRRHGARGSNLVVCEVDLRPGGAWRFVSPV